MDLLDFQSWMPYAALCLWRRLLYRDIILNWQVCSRCFQHRYCHCLAFHLILWNHWNQLNTVWTISCRASPSGNGLAPPSLVLGAKLRIGVIDSVDSRTIKNYQELLYKKLSWRTTVFGWFLMYSYGHLEGKATQYNGVAWPEMVFRGTGAAIKTSMTHQWNRTQKWIGQFAGEMHVFTIGDSGLHFQHVMCG